MQWQHIGRVKLKNEWTIVALQKDTRGLDTSARLIMRQWPQASEGRQQRCNKRELQFHKRELQLQFHKRELQFQVDHITGVSRKGHIVMKARHTQGVSSRAQAYRTDEVANYTRETGRRDKHHRVHKSITHTSGSVEAVTSWARGKAYHMYKKVKEHKSKRAGKQSGDNDQRRDNALAVHRDKETEKTSRETSRDLSK